MRHRDNKSFTRLYLAQDFAPEITCDLSENQIHYMRNVLRLSVGAQVIAFNGKDGAWLATLSDIAKKRGTVTLGKQITPQDTASDIWLVFAPIKKTRQDFLVEKATELGVAKLCPVTMTYSSTTRINHARIIAQTIEAAEQCERLTLPEVDDLQCLTDILNTWPQERTLFVCAEKGDALPAAQAFAQAKDKAAALLIGPEGGFSDDEITMLAAHPNTIMIDLSDNILRAETAALAALSCYQMIT